MKRPNRPRPHPLLRAILFGLIFATTMTLAMAAVLVVTTGRPVDAGSVALAVVPLYLILLVIFVVAIPLLVRGTARRMGGWDQYELFSHAIKTGEIPPTAQTAEWSAFIDHATRSRRSTRVLGWLALIWVAWQLVVLIRGLLDDPSIWPVALVIVAAISAIVWVARWWFRRQGERLEQLARALDERDSAP